MKNISAPRRPAQPVVLYGAVTVGTRGQMVIPQRLRRELGIEPGEQLLVLKDAGPNSFLVQRLDTLVRDPEDTREGPASSHAPGDEERADTPRAALAQELSALPHFVGLPPAVLDQLAALVHIGRYEPGTFIEREGEPCAAVSIVRSGLVRRFKTSTEGKEQVTRLSGLGESFGEISFFDGGPNYVTIQAVEATELYLFPHEALLALIVAEPAVALRIAKSVTELLRHFSTIVEDLSFRHVTGRVAHALLELTDETADVVRISQQELAAMAGTVREVAGRVLRTMEGAGVLHLERGKITLLDRTRLRAYA